MKPKYRDASRIRRLSCVILHIYTTSGILSERFESQQKKLRNQRFIIGCIIYLSEWNSVVVFLELNREILYDLQIDHNEQ